MVHTLTVESHRNDTLHPYAGLPGLPLTPSNISYHSFLEVNSSWIIEEGSVVNGSNGSAAEYPFSGGGSVTLQVLSVLLVMALAVFGNAIMCYAFYRTPNLRTLNNVFTLNLGLTDLSVAVIAMPMWMDTLIQGAGLGRNTFPPDYCSPRAFITAVLLLVSIATLACISLDRYLNICHPLEYPIAITQTRLYCVVAYVWVQSIALAGMPLLGFGYYVFRPLSIPVCGPHYRASSGYGLFLFLLGIAVPFLIMLYTYIRIIQAARKQAKRIQEIQMHIVQSSSSLSDMEESDDLVDLSGRRPSMLQKLVRRSSHISLASHKTVSSISRSIKTLKTVFIVVGAFFVCWGPYVVVQFYSVFHPASPVPYLAEFITTLLAFSNSAFNPFVFMLLNRDYRFALRITIARCLSIFPGQKDAVQRARFSLHKDSMMETIRIPSRASCDSGVHLELECLNKETGGQKVNNHLRPPGMPPQFTRLHSAIYDNPNFSMSDCSSTTLTDDCTDHSLVNLGPGEGTSRGTAAEKTHPYNSYAMANGHAVVETHLLPSDSTTYVQSGIPIIIIPPSTDDESSEIAAV